MAGESKKTTDHSTIRQWTESRGGRPATVKGTESEGEHAGLLRIEFPNYGGPDEDLEPVDWDDFFEKFDQENLALLYQDTTTEGEESRFYKFISR